MIQYSVVNCVYKLYNTKRYCFVVSSELSMCWPLDFLIMQIRMTAWGTRNFARHAHCCLYARRWKPSTRNYGCRWRSIAEWRCASMAIECVMLRWQESWTRQSSWSSSAFTKRGILYCSLVSICLKCWGNLNLQLARCWCNAACFWHQSLRLSAHLKLKVILTSTLRAFIKPVTAVTDSFC